MFDMPIKEWFIAERDRLRGMSWDQRCGHIWYYYKWHMILFLALISALILWRHGVSYARQEVLISGVFINADTSEEGYNAIKAYSEKAGRSDARSDVIETLVIRFTNPDPRSDDASMITQLDAMIAAKGLDYIICDEDALSWYAAADALLDLSELFPTETLITKPTAEGIEKAVGLSLEGSAFETNYALKNGPVYFAVLSNAPHLSEIPAFYRWLI